MTDLHVLEQAVERKIELAQAKYDLPDQRGHFGPYGGSFVSETLTHALNELKAAYARYKDDPEFLADFRDDLTHFVGRPSPVYHAKRWSEKMGGAQIYFKREDLNHTGAHKINNVIGQAYGQAAHHCRNRCRSTRCGHRHYLRPFWPRMCSLHGQ